MATHRPEKQNPLSGLGPARDHSRPCLCRFFGGVGEDVDVHVAGEAGPV